MKYWVIMVAALLTTLIFSPGVKGDNEIQIEIFLDKFTYLSNEKVTISYSIFSSDGRLPTNGTGDWTLYNWNGTLLSRGWVSTPSGNITINLDDYNLTSILYEKMLKFQISYMWSGEWFNKTVLIDVINQHSFSYSLNVIPLSGGYYPGSYIRIEIESRVGGLNVKYLKIYEENQTANKSVENYFINISNPLTLDVEGVGNYYYKIPENVTVGRKIDVVTNIENIIKNVNFTVVRDFGLYFFSNVDLNEDILSGDTLNLTIMSRFQVTGEYFHYYVYDRSGLLLEKVFTQNNNFTYHIRENYSGEIKIKCEIYNSTTNIGELEQMINVVPAKMRVYFDELTYTREDTFHTYVDFQSNIIKHPKFVYNIYENYGNGYLLTNSINTDKKSIEIKVPQTPPLGYKVVVNVVSDMFTYPSSATIEYYKPLAFRAYLLSRSPYVNGVFTPGQNVEIHFQIMQNYIQGGILYYGFGDEFYTNPSSMILNNKTEGNIVVEIPQYARSGIYEVHLMLIYDEGVKNTSIFVSVDSNPPWSLYGIFGIPLGDFIVTLLLVVMAVAIALYLIPRGEKEVKEQK